MQILVCLHAFVVLLWFVWLVGVLWVFLCVGYLSAVYAKSSNIVHTKHKKYNHFDISVGGGRGLYCDQVSILDYFVYRAGNDPMIFLYHCEKAIHDTADCGLVFISDADIVCGVYTVPNHQSSSCPSVRLPLVLGVVTRRKPQVNGSEVLGADESPWPCSTPSWCTLLS